MKRHNNCNRVVHILFSFLKFKLYVSIFQRSQLALHKFLEHILQITILPDTFLLIMKHFISLMRLFPFRVIIPIPNIYVDFSIWIIYFLRHKRKTLLRIQFHIIQFFGIICLIIDILITLIQYSKLSVLLCLISSFGINKILLWNQILEYKIIELS